MTTTPPEKPKDTRANSAADILRERIRRGEHQCGDRLLELDIAQRLSLSQTTVREALRLLEDEGWLLKTDRRGVRVRSFTPTEANEVYALWATAEALTVSQAGQRITKGFMRTLRLWLKETRRVAYSGPDTLQTSLHLLFDFHVTLAEIAALPQTGQLIRRLSNQALLLEGQRRQRQPRTLEAQEAQIQICERLLDALEDDDLDEAVALGREFVERQRA
ncbi:MAG: GntR family transcriptional regulator [Candidatus Obscuribacterales bacterium]|nr:GntR family transcriptional regulator [Steroidobacteraceae bacterium]